MEVGIGVQEYQEEYCTSGEPNCNYCPNEREAGLLF